MPKVTQEHLQARRQEILAAALACFIRKGYHQTTMQDICHESNLSPGAIYRYYASKEDLVAAAIEKTTAEANATMEGIRLAAPDTETAWTAIGRRFFDPFKAAEFEESARREIESWPEILRDEDLRSAMRRRLSLHRRSYASLLEATAREGRTISFNPDEKKTVANFLLGLYYGLTFLKAVDPFNIDTDSILEMERRLFSALSPEYANSASRLGTPPEGAENRAASFERKRDV